MKKAFKKTKISKRNPKPNCVFSSNKIKISFKKEPRKLYTWQVSLIYLLVRLYEWCHYTLATTGNSTAHKKNCVFEWEHALKGDIKDLQLYICMCASALFSRSKWQKCLRPQAFRLLGALRSPYCFYWIYGELRILSAFLALLIQILLYEALKVCATVKQKWSFLMKFP